MKQRPARSTAVIVCLGVSVLGCAQGVSPGTGSGFPRTRPDAGANHGVDAGTSSPVDAGSFPPPAPDAGSSPPPGYDAGAFPPPGYDAGSPPSSTGLCTPCTPGPCGSAGGVCLINSAGQAFCGQACSGGGCPAGFTCTTVTNGSASMQQCYPSSGSCPST